MTVIAEKDRSTVRDLLTRELVDDVELLLFTRGRSGSAAPGQRDTQSSEETRELLGELVALSDRLHLMVHDIGADPGTATRYNVTEAPTVLIRRQAVGADRSKGHGSAAVEHEAGSTDAPAAAPGEARAIAAEIGANVRFLGLPGGYEFSTLLADIVDVSKGRTDLAPEIIQAVRAIDTPAHIQVFVTPNCPYCPRAARVAHQMAMENPLIVADVIEANEFEALSERYQIRTVPKTVINDRVEFLGPLSEAKVLEALQEAVSKHG